MISSSLLKEPAQEGVIDLTKDDYVPMSKKLAFAFERESGILPGTSVKCIQLHCFSCIAMVNETEIIELPKCRHTFCYSCFIKAVHICKDIIISCPLSQCKEDISDKVLKIVLKTEDYILYLEKHCDVIKKNLKILQRNFAGYYDSPEQANEICSQQSEWQHLQNLETRDFIKNNHPFDCSICFSFVPIDKGVTLKNCLHSFCKECIAETIKHSNEQLVICPYASAEGSCEFHIQDREIRALVTPAVYEKHLSKGLKHAECNLPSFHCKTPDCGGWIELAGGVDAFECEVCRKVNCIKCQVNSKICSWYRRSLIHLISKRTFMKIKHVNSIKMT